MFELLSFLQRIFGGGTPKEDSRSAARDRLRLVLVSDRATVAPHLMESLRNDLIEVISRYMEIDVRAMQMGLERHDGAMALAANIPVRSVHRSSAEMPAVKAATAVLERPAPAPSPAPPAPAAPAPAPAPRPVAPPHLAKPRPVEESEEEFVFESSEGGAAGRLNPRRRSRKKARRHSRSAEG